MEKLMRRLLITASVLALAATISHAQAPILDCGADDEECLSNRLDLVCAVAGEHAESCVTWVQQLETHPFAGNPAWKLAAGRGYFLAAASAKTEGDAEHLRIQSRSIYQDIVEAWPDSPYAREGHMGLASLAPNIDEMISSLRNALRIEPSRPVTMTLLADALANRSGAGDLGEAAELYRNAYMESGDSPVWVRAQRALGLYTASGETGEAAAFREQLARDSGMAEFAEQVTSEGFTQDLERAAKVIETACNRIIAVIFSPDTCENGIDRLVVETRSIANPARRQGMADIATQGMSELAVLGAYTAVTAEEKRERDYRFGTILQEWIASGAATARVYVLWAQNPNSDLDEGIAAFEHAVELAPDNGRYRYWLAQGYIARGRYDEAIEHLNLARDTLPENIGITPESVDREIRRAEAGRSRSR